LPDLGTINGDEKKQLAGALGEYLRIASSAETITQSAENELYLSPRVPQSAVQGAQTATNVFYLSPSVCPSASRDAGTQTPIRETKDGECQTNACIQRLVEPVTPPPPGFEDEIFGEFRAYKVPVPVPDNDPDLEDETLEDQEEEILGDLEDETLEVAKLDGQLGAELDGQLVGDNNGDDSIGEFEDEIEIIPLSEYTPRMKALGCRTLESEKDDSIGEFEDDDVLNGDDDHGGA
jgi:hypothetical protein